MSLDITFVAEPADGDWDRAIDALEAQVDAGAAPTTEELARWDRIERRLATEANGLHRWADASGRELTDERTGLQLSLSPGEIALSVPYWYEGDEAQRIVELVRVVVRAVEEETGLVAYDPQAGGPFLDPANDPAAVFDQVHRQLGGPAAPISTPRDRDRGRLLSRLRGRRRRR